MRTIEYAAVVMLVLLAAVGIVIWGAQGCLDLYRRYLQVKREETKR
jgi:hypothetical protein